MSALVNHFRTLLAEKPIDNREANIFVDGLRIRRISDKQKEWLGSPFTLEELGTALKHMSNNKAPGTDGFPTEFYKIFWNDVKQYFFRMIQESYEVASLPNTLKEGIITLIPKPNKPRDEISSYRPITLLNSSYKIISSAIANRLKDVLPDVIGQEQTGFMKNRFIGDNTRLTYDIIQYLKSNDRTALLLSLDIQDAFNSVNWNFTRIVLHKRNFPKYIINWFDTLYVGSTSRIVYRGHISESITLQRSCRQGDPLSPYIFLLVIGVLLEKILNNPEIKGVKIKNKYFKISAYADDALCFLDGDENSCRVLFHDLRIFAKFSGLSPNIKKTQALWAGKNAEIKTPICAELNMQWVKKIKVLGIYFANKDEDVVDENFESKFEKVKKLIKDWKKRHLTLWGRVIIIKTLMLPIFTHIFTSLPRPTEQFIKKVTSCLFEFVWGGKVDRIKRSSIYRPVIDGGLAMIDIDVYISTLKLSWIKREIKFNHAWHDLFAVATAKNEFWWERNSASLRKIGVKIVNPFWAEVVFSLARLDNCFIPINEDTNRYCLWYSNITKYKEDEIPAWRKKGLRYINDIITENGQMMSFEEVKNLYNIHGTQFEYQTLIHSISLQWRRGMIKKEVTPFMHPNIELLLYKSNKYIYNIIIRHKYQ